MCSPINSSNWNLIPHQIDNKTHHFSSPSTTTPEKETFETLLIFKMDFLSSQNRPLNFNNFFLFFGILRKVSQSPLSLISFFLQSFNIISDSSNWAVVWNDYNIMMKHLRRLILLYCLTWCLCVCTRSSSLVCLIISFQTFFFFLSSFKVMSLNCDDDLENGKW